MSTREIKTTFEMLLTLTPFSPTHILRYPFFPILSMHAKIVTSIPTLPSMLFSSQTCWNNIYIKASTSNDSYTLHRPYPPRLDKNPEEDMLRDQKEIHQQSSHNY